MRSEEVYGSPSQYAAKRIHSSGGHYLQQLISLKEVPDNTYPLPSVLHPPASYPQ